MNAPQGNRPSQDYKLPTPLRRLALAGLAGALLYWAFEGLRHDDISLSQLPLNGFDRYAHFHGHWAWMAATGLILGTAAILIFIFEDVRTPPGQPVNRKLADRVGIGAMGILGALMALAFLKLI